MQRVSETLAIRGQQIPGHLSFLEALKLAADLLPGLAHDMQYIAERRKSQARDMTGIGRLALMIPEPAEKLLMIYHPELYEGEQEERGKAWKRFMNHPDARPFRVQANNA